MRQILVIWLSFLMVFSMLFLSFGSLDNASGSVSEPEIFAPSAPIRINSNAQFAAYASSGDGNPSTPWLINNLEIEIAGQGYCIYVGNTTDYFTITQCKFSNASGGSGSSYFTNSGVTLFNVENGNVTNNSINGNNGNGIYLNSTNWCEFTLNDITQNVYGLKSDNTSENNTIYHNNFLSNTVQAYDDGSNVWNMTAPTGGNFWSDWTTPDTNFDFFVDNPYAIPGSGEDPNIPPGYYDPALGLGGTALKTALHNVIKGHTELTYDDLWTVLMETDEDPMNSDNFILIYTGRSIPKTSVYPDWNREHVWAKSHGGFDTNPPAGTDAHHLRPCDVSVNSDRGNLDFDNGGVQNPEATECYADSDSWEPRNAVKGDVARMMFYMATRYDGDPADHGGLDLELLDSIPTSGSFFGKLSTLITWHDNDPVDDIDIHRNEIVYSNQINRNPFIDHPEYVDAIWGSGNPPSSGSGGGNNRDYLPFTIQEGWNAPPGPVHNIDQGTDHHMIQWAIDNATSGDTIMVDDGTYFENMIVDKALTIQATDELAIIDGGNSGTVVDIRANGVELSGFEIVNGGALATDCGIKLSNVDLCNIEDNNITGVYNGIFLTSGCNNNTIENNTVFTTEVGMNVQGSWNTIYHNNFLTNTNHTKDAGLNAWDMGFPVGGNFFDNWTSPDSNTDGFVDNPYIIPTGGGGGTSLDLDGYRIEQYGSSLTWNFGPGDIVQPGGYVVIGRWADQASFESFWGVSFGPEVLYINAENTAGSTFLVINGGETFELFDGTSISIDGPTGYAMVSGNSAQRTATTDDATLVGSWNIMDQTLATPGSGAIGDTSAGLVINEYSDASSYQNEFVELYYDSPSSGGVGSNNQDNWPFASENGWISAPVPSHSINLEQGWNLISLPWKQADTSPLAALSSIAGKWDRIVTYDPIPSNPWLTYDTSRPAQFNDNVQLDSDMAFWINVTQSDTTLYVYGTLEASTSIQLYAGWNLVGYPTETMQSITDSLAGTGYDKLVEIHNATAPYLIQTVPGSYLMRPGQGYWVHVPADALWTVDW